MTEKSDMHGAPVELSELLDYQPGAVVSRTVIKKSTGTVTLFAFDEGEELSEHTAAYEAMVIVVEGETEISISGQPHRVKSGQSLILPAKEPHAVRAGTRCKMLLIMIRS